MIDDVAGLRRILMECKTIAMVGLSANWYRPSYFAAKYFARTRLPGHARLAAL